MKPKKGQELVRIPPQWEDDEEVAANVMWPVCVVPEKTSFTNEDDTVQALKKMDGRHEVKGVGNKDNANDKVTDATEDNEKDKLPDAEAKGGGDEPNGMALPSRVGSATLHMAKA